MATTTGLEATAEVSPPCAPSPKPSRSFPSAYAIAALAERMLAANPALKAEFEAKVTGDAKFAQSPHARLARFYKRTPFYDGRYLLYPVGREI